MEFLKSEYLSLILISGFILVLSTFEVDAQYKVNKEKYNHKQYTSDMGGPYKPALAGVGSFIVPGLGQIYTDETKRGLWFLAGQVTSFGAAIGGFVIGFASSTQFGDILGGMIMYGGAAAFISIPIWSSIDAVRIAKIENMAWLDQQKTGARINLSPGLQVLPQDKVVPGMILRMTF